MQNKGITSITTLAAKGFYNNMKTWGKALSVVIIILLTAIFSLFSIIICIFHYAIGLDRINGNTGSYISEKSILLIKNLENYYSWEVKSYSNEPRKQKYEEIYKLNWEIMYAIDAVSNKDILINDTFDAFKPKFTYKESRIIKQDEKNSVSVQKILIPIVIDTYYKKLTYEYETQADTTTEEIDGRKVTTTVQKEVVREGYPIETENITARFLPYLSSIGIDDKDEIELLMFTINEKIKGPNEGIEYVEKYLAQDTQIGDRNEYSRE